MKYTIKSFIFDLGKVVLDFNHNIIADKLSQFSDFSKEEIFSDIFLAYKVNSYDLGEINSETFYQIVRQRLNLNIDYQQFQAIWNNIFSENEFIVNWIPQLSTNYPLYLLSNTNDLHYQHIISNYPIMNHFQKHILSFKEGCKKPNPEIYQIAIEQSQNLPHEILFIDDLLENVIGAQNVGLNAIQHINKEQLKLDLNKFNISITP